MSQIGPHLLGRVPSPVDARDYQLRWFLDATDPLEAALLVLERSHAAKATKLWAAIATKRLPAVAPIPVPAPTPVPVVPSPDVLWPQMVQLDQGDTGHCVGFGWAQYGTSDPVNDLFGDPDGHALYYECKVIDGEAGKENGSNVRSGATAMINRQRIAAYAFAQSTDEITAWLRQHGPLVVGTDWNSDMFDPDPSGRVVIGGSLEGGHCYLLDGVDAAGQVYSFQNSWGTEWGLHGRFSMSVENFAALLHADGEACAAVELPL